MRRRRGLVLAAVAVAAAQVGFLGWMILARAAVLRDGDEVRLAVEPVDPRDLLRGDYVTLGYSISLIPTALIEPDGDDAVRYAGEPIVVRVKRQSDGRDQAVAARFGAPPSGERARDEVDIGGVAAQGWAATDTAVRVLYGTERYYVPEGEGLAIETELRADRLSALLAVKGGRAQIKALYDGDAMLYQEPLY